MMRLLPLLRVVLELLLRSMRLRVVGAKAMSPLQDAGSPFVLAFWHGSMLVPWWLLRRRIEFDSCK